VQKLLGWDRSFDAVEAINDLHRNELRLWLNLYQPSVKLVKKVRVGSKLRRVYDARPTPLERVASSQGDSARVAEWKDLTTGFPLRLEIPHSPRDSHRHDGGASPFGYISNGATTPATVTFLNGFTRLIFTDVALARPSSARWRLPCRRCSLR
jgi:hypothetical protein